MPFASLLAPDKQQPAKVQQALQKAPASPSERRGDERSQTSNPSISTAETQAKNAVPAKSLLARLRDSHNDVAKDHSSEQPSAPVSNAQPFPDSPRQATQYLVSFQS